MTTYPAKLVLVGETGSGKTSVATRYVEDTFEPYQELTIGASFLSKTIDRDNHSIKFEIWDTAGQERYRALVPLYYKCAHAALIVYDTTCDRSYHGAKQWIERIKSGNTNCIIVLVGNKIDLHNKKIISTEKAKLFAEKNDIYFKEVSAKTSENIHELFAMVADKIPDIFELEKKRPPNVDIYSKSDTQSNSAACCYR